MRTYAGLLAFAFACLSTTAFGQGCPPSDGETIPQVEQLNQLMIDADYAGLTTALGDAGIAAASVIDTLSATFPNGFGSCTTLLQRGDAGTVDQTVLVFPNTVGTLYVYWRSGLVGDKFYIFNIYLNTDEAKVFDRVF